MHYLITIERTNLSSDENAQPTPITNKEWYSAIENNALFEFDIGLERQDTNFAELLDGSNSSWIEFEESGQITAENPSPLLIYHLILLANELNAVVFGENSEFYELTDTGFRSRVEYADGNQFHNWIKVETTSGFDFKSEND